MRPSLRLAAARVTLFTRAGCGLCDTAKLNLLQLHKRRPFDYIERDIALPENKSWKEVYDFDVPVAHVHSAPEATLDDARKLFHRFSEQEVEALVDEVEKQS